MADDSVAESMAAATLEPVPGSEAPPASGEQVVTPWDVQGGTGGIDYVKLLTTFGCQPIEPALIERCALCCRALALPLC